MFSGPFWICLSLPFVLLAAVYLWRHRQDRRQGRAPTATKLLRPAGETLRLELEDLNDKFNDAAFFAIIVPVIGAVIVGVSGSKAPPGAHAGAVIACGSVFLFGAVQTFRVLKRRRNVRLGFHGERATGEELNQLMREGCRVYHDVPLEPYGNVDHVIVAPSGVYAVETKARRKRSGPRPREEHVVVYDGTCLRFPDWTETQPLAQTESQAQRLQGFLCSAVGETVRVTPILVLPGWYVKRQARHGIAVLNPKSVRHVVNDRRKPTLDPVLIQRIAHQLEQRCRTVEL